LTSRYLFNLALPMLAFQYRAAVAAAAVLILFIMFIVALVLPWYSIVSQVVYQDLVQIGTISSVLNSTIAEYFTDRIVVTMQPSKSPKTVSTQFLDEVPFSFVIQTIRLAQAFTISSAILAFSISIYLISLSATRTLYSCSRFCGRGTLKGYLVFSMLLLFITSTLAVLLFLDLPVSLSKDNSSCRGGACAKFVGSISISLGFEYSSDASVAIGEYIRKDDFGPGAGWIIAAVAAPISLFLVIISCCCRLPFVTVFDDPDDPDGARVSNLQPSFAVL
jgi:hypothetical protein